jgi:prepilin-type N-terminal cleavage/methylation domain-containing protein
MHSKAAPQSKKHTMSISRHTRHHSGFTLIELLVVITIIGILASMAFPVVTGVMTKARKVRTLAIIKDLHVAIKGYQTEYNHYPSKQTEEKEAIKTDESGGQDALIKILLAAPSQQKPGQLNTRGIKFIDLPIAKNERGGLVGTEVENYKLVDEWGQPYNVLMDLDGDEKVKNPDAQNEDTKIKEGASPYLPVGVAVYSFGPDGEKKQTPSKDDVTSWRG